MMATDKWEWVTSYGAQWADIQGDAVKRIEVPGGWIYAACPSGSNQSPSLVFVPDPDGRAMTPSMARQFR